MSDSQTVYSSVAHFVENYLSLVYARNTGPDAKRVWCPRWWAHAEAVTRLECVWRAWEHHRTYEGNGLSGWFLDHADPHMAVLLDPYGPFELCGTDQGHVALPPLSLVEPPRGLFSDTGAAPDAPAEAVPEDAAGRG